MRYFVGLALIIVWLGTAAALTPLPDPSPGFFSGEWAGNGQQGAYCYLNLSADGWGWVLIDGGTGDWLGARMQWRNQQQSLHVEQVIPLQASAQLRVLPLEKFVLSSGLNQSLKLTWNEPSGGCHLQKLDTVARHLLGARKTLEGLISGANKR